MDNYTITSSTLPFLPEDYNLEHYKEGDWYAGMAALVAAIAAAIGSVIYAAKHVRHSECLGSKCDQDVVVEVAHPRNVKNQETNV